MRTLSGLLAAALMMLVMTGGAQAQTAVDQAAALLNRFPNGGDSLIVPMEGLLAANPTAACAIVRRASSGNRAQKTAVAEALARARRLISANSAASADQLETASSCGDGEFIAAYASAKAVVNTSVGLLVPRVTGGEYGMGVVSRSRP